MNPVDDLPVTIVWTRASEPFASDGVPIRHENTVVTVVSNQAIPSAVIAALVRGAVVAVVETDREAATALRLGADEVLRFDALDAEAIDRAIERARLRGQARAARSRARNVRQADSAQLELLAGAIARHLNAPIAAASVGCDILKAAIGSMAGIADEFARVAIEGERPPVEELRRIVAIRASAPPSYDLQATIDEVRASLLTMASTVARMSVLVLTPDVEESCELGPVLLETGALLRPAIERVGRLELDVPDVACPVALPRWQIVQCVAVLVSDAIDAIAATGGDAVVCVRLIVADGVATIVVADNATHQSAEEIRSPSTAQHYCARADNVAAVASVVRRAGGDLVVESNPGLGNVVRIFLGIRGADRSAAPSDSTASN